MINNLHHLFQTIWHKIFGIFLQATDAFYRVFVRLLYHSKIVGVLALFWIIIFATSAGFFISIFSEAQSGGGQNNHQGFYAIDVGQGDSSLYITKENQTVLIDTGKPGNGIVQKMEKILGKYRKKIDVIVLTHPDSDHVGEIENILASYEVGLILYSPIYDVRPDSVKSIENIRIKNHGLTLPVFAGENLSFSENRGEDKKEAMYFLSPSFYGMATFASKKELAEDNYFSVVSLIKSRDLIFTMADAPQKIEKVLVSSSGNTLSSSSPASVPVSETVDIFYQLSYLTGEELQRNQFDKIILKAGHHGSKTSSAPEFIKKLSPTDVILSYGKNNRYGHPHKEVLDLLMDGFLTSSSTVTATTSPTSFMFPKTKIHQTFSGTVYFGE
jgi:competence protein ComEC